MNKKSPVKKQNIPYEIEDIATTSDVSALEDKVARCYSADRYKEFQDAVEEIVLRKIDTADGGEKIKKHAADYFQGKIVWGVLIWLITMIATALAQKYFNILG